MREIEFINRRYIFLFVSFFGITITTFVLFLRGLNLGLDFTGGTLVQLSIYDSNMNIQNLRNIFSKNSLKKFSIQDVITNEKEKREYIIRVQTEEEKRDTMSDKIKEILAKENIKFEVLRREYVGPTIGRHLSEKALSAILYSLLGIIVYVGFRFRSSIWGIAGVIALMHDVFLTVGFLMILNKEITLNIVAALLTLAGYSINDTIVIFDRIRENIRLIKKEPLDRLINKSINETLPRTILTSLTTMFAVMALFIFGNEVIKDFALSLVFGVIVGTYSSIFVASALVLEYNKLLRKKQVSIR